MAKKTFINQSISDEIIDQKKQLESFLGDLAMALTMNESYEMKNYIDLTDGCITNIMDEFMLDDITDNELEKYNDWQREMILTYRDHDLIEIESISTHESFEIMESFADSQPEDVCNGLFDALNRRHPFSNFQTAVRNLGVLQEWYDFKNNAEREIAVQWLKDNDLEFVEGKVRKS